MSEYLEVNSRVAENEYCRGRGIYICTDKRQYWKIPANYEIGGHELARVFFDRGLPRGE